MATLFERVESLIREMIREEIALAFENGDSRITNKPSPEVTAELTPIRSPDRLLKAAEVAEILDVSVARVYELVRQRKSNGFPVIVLGERQYRFSREQIFGWLQRE